MNLLAHFRTMNRRRIARRRLAKDPVMTPYGFLFNGLREMQNGTFEPDEVELFQSLMPKIDLFVNIGAHMGFYTCTALHHGVFTRAFEPLPNNYQHLVKNIKSNGWADKAVVLPVAVGDQNDLTQLHGSGSGASLLTGWANAPSTMHSDVSVVTVDGVIPPLKSETALFWVDVEGFEAQVLKGATNILAAKNKAIWVIEILRKLPLNGEEVDNPDFKSIFDLMAKSGYQTYSAAKTPVKLSSQADFDANPDVINFLFVDAEKAALLGL